MPGRYARVAMPGSGRQRRFLPSVDGSARPQNNPSLGTYESPFAPLDEEQGLIGFTRTSDGRATSVVIAERCLAFLGSPLPT